MSNHVQRAALLAAILFIPVACGGPAGSSGTLTPAAGPSAAKQSIRIKIKIPKRAATKNRHHGHYVSPATTVIMLNVRDSGNNQYPGYPITVGLTPTSSGCTSTLANTLCQLSISLPPASYYLTLATEDQNGNTISTAVEIPVTIVAGHTNNLSLTLDGIPHGMVVGQLTAGSSSFVVNAVDVDGNVIVGSGAPTFALSATSGIPVTFGQPAATTPNTFSASTNATGTAVITITASYPSNGGLPTCSQSGAVCSVPFNLTAGLASTSLFVANYFGGVLQFASPYTGSPTASNSIGMDEPFQIAFDPSGNLFVANSRYNDFSVTGYSPGYTGAPSTTITNGLQGALGVAFDSSGNLYVAGAGLLLEYAAPYTGAPIFARNDLGNPYSLAFDSAGHLFVSDVGGNVYELGSPYTGTPLHTITNGLSGPVGLLVTSTGNLFVANQSAPNITEYASPYTGAPILTMHDASLTQPWFLAMDASNNLWVSDPGNNTIAEYASPYTGAPMKTINNINLSGPSGIAFHNSYSLSISP